MNKKKIIILTITLILLSIGVFGISYAYLSAEAEMEKVNLIKSGILKVDIDEKMPITLLANYPITTESGLNGTPYEFTLSNVGNIDGTYTIYLDDFNLPNNVRKLDDKYIRYSLIKNNKYVTETVADLLSETKDRIIDNGVIYQGENISYKLLMWIDEETEISEQGKEFKAKIRIEGEQLDDNSECFTVKNGVITSYSQYCSKELIIPSTIRNVKITGIGDGAFYSKGLTRLSLPNTITNIGNYAFSDNKLPNDEAFIYMRNSDGSVDYTTLISYGGEKDEVIIPEGVKVITKVAFLGCGITSVKLPSTLNVIGGQVFQDNSLTELDIPVSVYDIQGSAFNNNLLKDEDAFIYRRNRDGSVDYTTLVSYGGAKKSNIVIPEGVERLASGSFSYHTNITSVIMPSSLKVIESMSFYNTGLTSLEIPSNVIEIGVRAFNFNNVPDESAFVYKRNNDGSIDNTTLISYAGRSSNLIIPSNVTTIESGSLMFANYVGTIVLHNNIKIIGSSAFSSMVSLGKIINPTGNSYDWGLIINGASGYNFETGTVVRVNGNVEVVEE